MIWVMFIFFEYAHAACLNGGTLEGGVCSCIDGYSGRHCQIQRYGTPCNATEKENFDTLQNLTSSGQAQIGQTTLPICNGNNFPCYYRPGLSVSNKCLPQFSPNATNPCPADSSVTKDATCEYGCTPEVFQQYCCAEHAKCEDHVCPVTEGEGAEKERLIYNVGDKGYVITHTEDGACKNQVWYFDKVTLYDTIPNVLNSCTTFIEFADVEGIVGYACHQTKQWCTGTPVVCLYSQSDLAVHRSECNEGVLQGGGNNMYQLTWATSSSAVTSSGTWVTYALKTHTATQVPEHVSALEYYTSLDSNGAECCNYEKVCEDYNSGCDLPLKNVGSEIFEDGEEASECCEPKTWRCDNFMNHSNYTCGVGFEVTTKRCGPDCATKFNTTLLGEYTGIPITSGSKNNCIGDGQGNLTPSECLEKCKGRYDNYFIKNETCYCADGITSQCVADVGSACNCNIERKTFAQGTPGYYSVSVDTLTVCKSWNWETCSYEKDGWDYVDVMEDGSYNAAQYQACVKGEYNNYYSGNCGTGWDNTCCDPIRYDTYNIITTVTREGTDCCETDTGVTLTACLSQTCTGRYTEKNDYDTGFYTTNHTRDCCDWIPDNHYCWGTTCASGSHPKRGFNTSYYCGGECENSQCCVPDNHYCDTFTCPANHSNLFFNLTEAEPVPISNYFTTTGDCQIIDTCVTSPNYPSFYDNSQTCTITALVSGPLTVDSFETESCCDKLQVGGTAYGSGGTIYKGTNGPVGVSLAIEDKMFWRSDGSSVRTGWKVCLPLSYHEVPDPPDPDCNGTCTESRCCAHVNEFCDSQTCINGDITTGVDRCNGTCVYGDCCVAGEPCDTTYVCNSGMIIDTDYRCKNMENGVCAQTEYSGTEGCCKTSKECSTASSFYNSDSGDWNSDLGLRVGKSIPGCNAKSDYYTRYKDGAILSGDDWTADVFQNNCCQYFQQCKGSVGICGSGQYNLGDYNHQSWDHLYCWKPGSDDQNCTAEHQSICCQTETCETARSRINNMNYNIDLKPTWTCTDDNPFIENPTQIIGSVISSESDFRSTCCSAAPPLWGVESRPDGVVWGNKVITRTANGLSIWNSAGVREFDGDYSIYGKSIVEAIYYNVDTLHTGEDIWDTTSSSWAEGIVKYDLSAPAFEVSGNCIAYAHYVTTPNFPANYPSNSNCVITALRSGKGMFSRIRIGSGDSLVLPDLSVLTSSNAGYNANRYAVFPYTQINVGDTFTWITDGSSTSYGFQLMMMEEFYVAPNDIITINDWVDYYGGRYQVKVMDNVLVYYAPSIGKIQISSLQNSGSTVLLSYLIDSSSDKDDGEIFVDIQKSGSDYLVAVAQQKKCSDWMCSGGISTYVYFFKVTGNSASLISRNRNYGSSTGDDKNFHNVVCSPDTTNCYAVSYWRNYYDGDLKYKLTKYTVDLSASSVVRAGVIDLGYSCDDDPIAVSDGHVAHVCYSQVHVYAHGSGAPTSVTTIAENPRFIKFSPDGSKLLLSFSSDQGSDQYMKVYKIPEGTCIVGPGCTNSLV